MAVRDEKHQEMYLRMYEKGQQTALRERQEEVGTLYTWQECESILITCNENI